MSSDETPKIEPTLTDAPSIAPEAKPEPVEATPRIEETTKVEAKSEPETVEPKIEPKIEKPAAPTLPPAAQIAEPGKAIVMFRRPEAKTEQPAPASSSRSTRFALLAACVAIAASFGAIGGSLGVAKFAPMVSPQQTAAVSVAKEHMADEIKALKETVAQLRTHTKSLNDNLAALKTSMTASTSAQNSQIGKIVETLDRVEKTQTEQRKTVAAAPMTSTTQAVAAQDVTGSIQPKTPVPMVLGSPPTTLKPPIVQGWVLRRVYDGAALIESRNGIIEVEPGSVVPGLGRVEDIKRQDGRWVMMTSRGMVVGR